MDAPDAFLSTLSTSHDLTRASLAIGDLAKFAPAFARDPDATEAAVIAWAADDPLRKGISAAWLERARSMAATAVKHVGDLGERAGAAIEPHTPAGAEMRAYAAGTRGNVTTEAGKQMALQGDIAGRRTADAAHALEAVASPHTAAARQAALRGERTAGGGRAGRASELAADHAKQLGRNAYADGQSFSHRQGIDNRNKAYARFGRVAAVHGFKAGVAAAGAGGVAALAVGASRALSDKEHAERVNAARARWGNRGAQR